MPTNPFTPATREQMRARIGLLGPAGSGKTLSGLLILRALVGPEGKMAVIDSEHDRSRLYVGREGVGDFDHLALETHHPSRYIEAIRSAEAYGYDGVLVDSLSHAWAGREGALELVDKAALRLKGNSYVAWGEVTPLHVELIETMLAARLHLIATMRTKMAYVLEERNGKQVPVKLGMQPVQREGMEYEFDVVGDLDHNHRLAISKSRYEAIDGQVIDRPGGEFGATILEWLEKGAPAKRDEEGLLRVLRKLLDDDGLGASNLKDLIGGSTRREVLDALAQYDDDPRKLAAAVRADVDRRIAEMEGAAEDEEQEQQTLPMEPAPAEPEEHSP